MNSYVSRNNDICTNKFNYPSDLGKYAKLFRIKMINDVWSNHSDMTSLYFDVYWESTTYASKKSFSCNAYGIRDTDYNNIRLEDLTPDNQDFEVVAIFDGTYATFYLSGIDNTTFDQIRANVIFTKVKYFGFVEILSNEWFDNDIEQIIAENATYKLIKSVMPTIIYNKEKGLKTDTCFKVNGTNKGYTKIFDIDFSDVGSLGTNYALMFSTNIYTSTLSTKAVCNIYSLFAVYSSSESKVASAKLSMISGFNSDKVYKELPCYLVANDKNISVYIDHTEQDGNSIIVHVLSQYQSNNKVNTSIITNEDVITTLPSGSITSTVREHEELTITYANDFVQDTDYECKAVRTGNKIDVTLNVTGTTTGTGVKICDLPYTNNGKTIDVPCVQYDGTNYTFAVARIGKGTKSVTVNKLENTKRVSIQLSYYI